MPDTPLGVETPLFEVAQPVWPTGRDKDRNLTVGFRAVFEEPPFGPVVLRVAGATIYRAFLNGRFVCHGPARGPHGFYRVDQWDVSKLVASGRNVLAIEVAGYNVNSYYLLNQPSFLQAELVGGGKVLAATGTDETCFEAGILPERVQKVARYSFQRPFSEAYRLSPGYDAWRTDLKAAFERARCTMTDPKALVPRHVPRPTFATRAPVWLVSNGKCERLGKMSEGRWRPHFLIHIGTRLGGFLLNNLSVLPSDHLMKLAMSDVNVVDQPMPKRAWLKFIANSFAILDFGSNLTGFVGLRVKCKEPVRLYLAFDEILTDGDVDFRRMTCLNIVMYTLAPGTYDLETMEPYTLRYLKLISLDGECQVQNVYMREYVHPHAERAEFAASDRKLNRLFEAARETFRQNAVDIYMDCPSRERAGWLCDSFFTARVERDLCGESRVERAFLENFLLPARFKPLPKGMLPMCYPSDHPNGRFIPNWALWFVVQLEEYLARTGDRDLIEAMKPKVMALFDYFGPFVNDDGLLEGLESWVFIEWSKANDFVQDVNYPSNMLFAGALAAAGRMYEMPELSERSSSIIQTVRDQSFDGEFFVDNAVREKKSLTVTTNRSEACQYYAFFFGAATPEEHPELWQRIVNEFGPGRKETNAFPDVHPANAFIGNYLRLEALSRAGLAPQLLEEVKGYFLGMAERTGTLWENDTPTASCDHGFASHIAHILYRDILGVDCVDARNRKVSLSFSDVPLEWCSGKVPIEGQQVALSWWREDDGLHYRCSVPAGYTVAVQNRGKAKLVPEP